MTYHSMAKHCPEVSWKSRSEARNLPTRGCKSMVEGLKIMLGVFNTFLYTQARPNKHCCSTYLMAYHHLMAKHWPEVYRNSWSEAWNLPTWGCKSMVEGPTIMLRVFITILCIHTMPINHYYSTYMMAYYHLKAKLAWELAENRDFFLIWGMNLPMYT